MTDTEINKQTCLKFFELATTGQFDAAKALLHDNVEWAIIGDLPWSGSHFGQDDVMNLFTMLGQIIAPPITLNFTTLTAEEDRVAIEMNSDCTLLNGSPYKTVYHQLFRLKDGKIVYAKEYFDTKYVAAVLPM